MEGIAAEGNGQFADDGDGTGEGVAVHVGRTDLERRYAVDGEARSNLTIDEDIKFGGGVGDARSEQANLVGVVELNFDDTQQVEITEGDDLASKWLVQVSGRLEGWTVAIDRAGVAAVEETEVIRTETLQAESFGAADGEVRVTRHSDDVAAVNAGVEAQALDVCLDRTVGDCYVDAAAWFTGERDRAVDLHIATECDLEIFGLELSDAGGDLRQASAVEYQLGTDRRIVIGGRVVLDRCRGLDHKSVKADELNIAGGIDHVGRSCRGAALDDVHAGVGQQHADGVRVPFAVIAIERTLAHEDQEAFASETSAGTEEHGAFDAHEIADVETKGRTNLNQEAALDGTDVDDNFGFTNSDCLFDRHARGVDLHVYDAADFEAIGGNANLGSELASKAACGGSSFGSRSAVSLVAGWYKDQCAGDLDQILAVDRQADTGEADLGDLGCITGPDLFGLFEGEAAAECDWTNVERCAHHFGSDERPSWQVENYGAIDAVECFLDSDRQVVDLERDIVDVQRDVLGKLEAVRGERAYAAIRSNVGNGAGS